MKTRALAFLFTIVLASLPSVASANTIYFNNTECPSCVNTQPVIGNEWSAFGLTVSNAYWYTDSRDTFDHMGLSVYSSNPGAATGTASIGIAPLSNDVTFDWLVLAGHTGLYEAFDASHTSLGSLFVDASNTGNLLGTHTFTGLVQSLNWTGDPGYADLSTLTTTVPEPGTYALMLAGLGLLGFFARRSRRDSTT